MDYIRCCSEEYNIFNNSQLNNRNNSKKIDYFNKINEKPWGKEYLAYQNSKIGIWILHINKEQETSLHCHFKKDTILIPLQGSFKINLFNSYKLVNTLDKLYIPKKTFHGIYSYSNDSILMEIEIYTDEITYTDKNDLLRIRDIYNRDKDKYETSVTERDAIVSDHLMNFHNETSFHLYHRRFELGRPSGESFQIVGDIRPSTNSNVPFEFFEGLNETIVDITEIFDNSLSQDINDISIILEGSIYTNGHNACEGSIINLKEDFSLITRSFKVLNIRNLNIGYLNKIIYSKQHLNDYLLLNNSPNIGLTSGCFDILHSGHINNLKMCKKHCDKLFVCLSSDNQIKRLKGELRPINSIDDRIHMLIHFSFIDIIILYDEINDSTEIELDNIMNIVKPMIWFKGADYNKEDILKKHPGLKNIILLDLLPGKSTTNIVNKINGTV